MTRTRVKNLWVLALGFSLGCGEKLRDGASAVFVKTVVCPASRVSVTARPDVAPHTIYSPPRRTPPADIAADPGRLELWKSQQPTTPDVDAIAKSYTVTGCGQTALYACGHPRMDGGDGPFSVTVTKGPGNGTVVQYNTKYFASIKDGYTTVGNTLESAVVCVPASGAGS